VSSKLVLPLLACIGIGGLSTVLLSNNEIPMVA